MGTQLGGEERAGLRESRRLRGGIGPHRGRLGTLTFDALASTIPAAVVIAPVVVGLLLLWGQHRHCPPPKPLRVLARGPLFVAATAEVGRLGQACTVLPFGIR